MPAVWRRTIGQEGTLSSFRKLLGGLQQDEPGFTFELSVYTGKPAFVSPEGSKSVEALAQSYRQLEEIAPLIGGIKPFMFIG